MDSVNNNLPLSTGTIDSSRRLDSPRLEPSPYMFTNSGMLLSGHLYGDGCDDIKEESEGKEDDFDFDATPYIPENKLTPRSEVTLHISVGTGSHPLSGSAAKAMLTYNGLIQPELIPSPSANRQAGDSPLTQYRSSSSGSGSMSSGSEGSDGSPLKASSNPRRVVRIRAPYPLCVNRHGPYQQPRIERRRMENSWQPQTKDDPCCCTNVPVMKNVCKPKYLTEMCLLLLSPLPAIYFWGATKNVNKSAHLGLTCFGAVMSTFLFTWSVIQYLDTRGYQSYAKIRASLCCRKLDGSPLCELRNRVRPRIVIDPPQILSRR